MLSLQSLSLVLAAAGAFLGAYASPQQTYSSGSGNGTNSTADAVYKDPHASVDDRIADLLSRMTLHDKMAQLMQGDISNWMDTTDNSFNYSGLVASMDEKAGSFYVGYPVTWSWIAENVKKGQDYLLQNTTLGIPAFVQSEGIHGFLIGNATIFNSPIGYACSFNKELVQKMAAVVAQESLALGVNQIFAPLADLARELRFGRVEETFGEDPYLTGEMAYSYVKGLQGGNVSAMVKHFAAFSAPEQGLNTAPVHGGERELRRTWLPPFKRSMIDAGAYSAMLAYNSYDGIPAVADYHTLTEILRGEWGYEYFTMSDAGGTDRICNNFKLCTPSPNIDSEAITMYALPAGCDVEMGGGSFNYRTIPDLVDSGTLDESIVDTAVSRFLRAKFEMGLFEHPYEAVPISQESRYIHTDESVALARQLDAESIVLLENHDQSLPLSKNANIAVIGPMAHGFMNYGDYVVYESQYRGVTPLDGIRAASTGTVTYAQGCERWSNDQSGFAEAIDIANAADVAVVVVGTWSRDQMELWQGLNATTGEHVDVSSLNLVGAMPHLVQAIIDTGKPTIVVFQSGKPVTEPQFSKSAAGLIQQFYPSEQGGHALADVLYGKHNPSGKLSVSIPTAVGTAGTYDYLNSGRTVDPGYIAPNGSLVFGHQYVLDTPVPLYEFGYGKSYTTFEYSNVTLSSTTAGKSDTVTASVQVTNSGSMDGQEVVQLYVQDVISSVVVPNMELKGFEKVMIKAGETATVSIPIDVSNLGVWNVRMQYVVESGDFNFWMGSSSADLRGVATLSVS